MRKLVFIMISLVLLVGMVVGVGGPAVAAPEKLTFDTEMTCGPLWIRLLGSVGSGFKLHETLYAGFPAGTLLDLNLIAPAATPALVDDKYPFYLQANPAEKAKLKAYFQTKMSGIQLAQIYEEIDGIDPFFYLKAAGGVYSLVDGFMYGLGYGEGYTLRINNDYPAGNYMYTGTLEGQGDVSLTLSVKLEVCGPEVNYPDGSLKADLCWWHPNVSVGYATPPRVGEVIFNTTAAGELSVSIKVDSAAYMANKVDWDVELFVADGINFLPALYPDILDTNARGKGSVTVRLDVSSFEGGYLWILFKIGQSLPDNANEEPPKYAGGAWVTLK